MAYSDFTARDLTQRFGIKFKAATLFADSQPITPTPWLLEALTRGQELGFGSEKSRSERLVTPILLELSNLNQHSFSIYSGMNLDADQAVGLNGECDFIFSFSRIQDFVTAPIFCITEAKKQDLEQGTVQAAAQLLGARKLNELEGNSFETLYACSTTGIEWRFLQYNANTVVIDEKRYLLSDLPVLLGVLQHIVGLAKAEGRDSQ
jgi:hypothetical protein